MTEEEEEKLREEMDPTGGLRTMFIVGFVMAIFWTVVIIIAVA